MIRDHKVYKVYKGSRVYKEIKELRELDQKNADGSLKYKVRSRRVRELNSALQSSASAGYDLCLTNFCARGLDTWLVRPESEARSGEIVLSHRDQNGVREAV